MTGYDTVTLLTDRGQVDEAVGVVRSILADMAPSANVVDLTHGIDQYDVRAGALALARSVPYIASGVVLASVDPDGSSQRRSIAVEVGDGVGVLVGPDNGLLANAVAMIGGAGRTVELTDERYRLPSAGELWELRDVLAPVAAHLCEGVDLAEFGPAIDPASLLPSLIPIPRFENEQVLAEVMWVDHFGRVQLNLEAEMIDQLGKTIVVTSNGQPKVVMRHRSINDVPDGQVGLVTDTFGLMALVSPLRSAADEFGIAVGTEVVLSEAR